MKLTTPIDVVKFVRNMEQLVLSVLRRLGLEAVTVEGRSGAWITADERGGDRKISAIGVQVSKRTTMHGIAINCSNDLEAFRSIIPCGIMDAGVTTISRELGRTVTPAEVKDLVIDELIAREAELCEVSEIPADAVPLPWPAPSAA
jgi:lipoyl(octanoyl) transferase